MNESKKLVKEGYNQALEHIQFIYNRLYVQGKLEDVCLKCPIMAEINKILEMSREIQIEAIERIKHIHGLSVGEFVVKALRSYLKQQNTTPNTLSSLQKSPRTFTMP